MVAWTCTNQTSLASHLERREQHQGCGSVTWTHPQLCGPPGGNADLISMAHAQGPAQGRVRSNRHKQELKHKTTLPLTQELFMMMYLLIQSTLHRCSSSEQVMTQVLVWILLRGLCTQQSLEKDSHGARAPLLVRMLFPKILSGLAGVPCS